MKLPLNSTVHQKWGQLVNNSYFLHSDDLCIEFREYPIVIKVLWCLLVGRHSCLAMLCDFYMWSSVVKWPREQQTSLTSSTSQPANYLPNQMVDVVPKAFGSWLWRTGTSCTWFRMRFMMAVLYLTLYRLILTPSIKTQSVPRSKHTRSRL